MVDIDNKELENEKLETQPEENQMPVAEEPQAETDEEPEAEAISENPEQELKNEAHMPSIERPVPEGQSILDLLDEMLRKWRKQIQEMNDDENNPFNIPEGKLAEHYASRQGDVVTLTSTAGRFIDYTVEENRNGQVTQRLKYNKEASSNQEMSFEDAYAMVKAAALQDWGTFKIKDASPREQELLFLAKCKVNSEPGKNIEIDGGYEPPKGTVTADLAAAGNFDPKVIDKAINAVYGTQSGTPENEKPQSGEQEKPENEEPTQENPKTEEITQKELETNALEAATPEVKAIEDNTPVEANLIDGDVTPFNKENAIDAEFEVVSPEDTVEVLSIADTPHVPTADNIPNLHDDFQTNAARLQIEGPENEIEVMVDNLEEKAESKLDNSNAGIKNKGPKNKGLNNTTP